MSKTKLMPKVLTSPTSIPLVQHSGANLEIEEVEKKKKKTQKSNMKIISKSLKVSSK